MTSRDAFEAHLGIRLHQKVFQRKTNDTYYSDIVQTVWESWKTAERDMLERAIAVVADETYPLTSSEIVDKLKGLLNEPNKQ